MQMGDNYNPYNEVLEIVRQAADLLGYAPKEYEAIKYPERELKVSVPVEMDDGSVRVFEGFRIQHSTSLSLIHIFSTAAGTESDFHLYEDITFDSLTIEKMNHLYGNGHIIPYGYIVAIPI